jgi:hypothetical protein
MAAEFTSQLLEFLESLTKNNSKSVFISFRDKIKTAEKMKEIKTVIKEFEFYAWLESKIEGGSVGEILSKRN